MMPISPTCFSATRFPKVLTVVLSSEEIPEQNGETWQQTLPSTMSSHTMQQLFTLRDEKAWKSQVATRQRIECHGASGECKLRQHGISTPPSDMDCESGPFCLILFCASSFFYLLLSISALATCAVLSWPHMVRSQGSRYCQSDTLKTNR